MQKEHRMKNQRDVNISKCYTIRGTPAFFDKVTEFAKLKGTSVANLVKYALFKQDEEFKRLQAEAKGGVSQSLRD